MNQMTIYYTFSFHPFQFKYHDTSSLVCTNLYASISQHLYKTVTCSSIFIFSFLFITCVIVSASSSNTSSTSMRSFRVQLRTLALLDVGPLSSRAIDLVPLIMHSYNLFSILTCIIIYTFKMVKRLPKSSI